MLWQAAAPRKLWEADGDATAYGGAAAKARRGRDEEAFGAVRSCKRCHAAGVERESTPSMTTMDVIDQWPSGFQSSGLNVADVTESTWERGVEMREEGDLQTPLLLAGHRSISTVEPFARAGGKTIGRSTVTLSESVNIRCGMGWLNHTGAQARPLPRNSTNSDDWRSGPP